MQACQEATQLIMSLTHQVAQLKQLSTTEHLQRGQILDAGADILKAWQSGTPYNKALHARWAEASDPKTLEKKFKAINKEFEAKAKEKEAEMAMTPEERANVAKEKAAEAQNAQTKLDKAQHNADKHEQKVADHDEKRKEKAKQK